MGAVLEGVRVLDLARGLAGSLAGAYLSDQGAEVIKVEPPGGDPTRAWSASRVWNRGKKSVVLDLKDPDGRAMFERLAGTADVLLESFRPGVMDGLGLGYGVLHERFPRLIYCSITGYGRTSASKDRPAYDALVQARMGMNFEQPSYRKEAGGFAQGPVFLYVPLPSYGAMLLAGTGIAAALHAREVNGAGQWVETSLAQGALVWTSQIRYRAEHEPPNFATIPYATGRSTVFECADGQWVHLMVVRNSNETMYDLLDVDPRGRDVPGVRATADERFARRVFIEEAFKRKPRDEVLALLEPAGVPIVPVQSAADAYTTPQLVHNGMIVTVDDPDEGPLTMIGIPYQLEKNPTAVQGPQPRLGADDAAILGSLEPVA